jgi:hypothetical protein
MKKVLLSVLGLVLLVSSSSAQNDERRIAISAGGGVALPISPKQFRDAWKMGSLSVGGSVGYSVTPAFAVSGSVDYSTFQFDEDGFLKASGVADDIAFLRSMGIPVTMEIKGGDVTILAASVNGKASIAGSAVSPYFVAGAGLMNLSVEEVSVSVTAMGRTDRGTASVASETAFFVTGGPGLDIHAGEMVDIFVQGTLGFGLTKGQSTLYVPVKGGVTVKL